MKLPAADLAGGAPCRDNENAFIFACMSEFSPLARLGSGPGLRAAFVGPSGAEEGFIEAAMPAPCEPSDGGLVGDCGLEEVVGDDAESESSCSGDFEISGEDGC